MSEEDVPREMLSGLRRLRELKRNPPKGEDAKYIDTLWDHGKTLFNLVREGDQAAWRAAKVVYEPTGLRGEADEAFKMAYQSAQRYFDSLTNGKPHEGISSWLERTFPELRANPAKLAEYLGKISERIKKVKKLNGGYSSNDVLSLEGVIVKVDRLERAQAEHRNLSLNLRDFAQYAPKPLRAPDATLAENIGLWCMSDVRQGISGFDMSGIKDPIEHYLFVLGLFHHYATEAVKNEHVVLPVGPQKMDGMDYITRIFTVSHHNEKVYKATKLDSPRVNGLRIPLKDITELLRGNSNCVIHDNYKAGNMENGYVTDHHHWRWGHEIEDIMRFLLDPDSRKFSKEARFGPDAVFGLIPDAEYYIGRYIQLRSSHDQQFKEDHKKHEELYRLASQAAFKEEVRYCASMSRRDLSQPEPLGKRDGFLYRAERRLSAQMN